MASGSRSIVGGSDETLVYECDPCKYQNVTSEAKAFCTVCTEYLCKACEQSHKGLNATRDHKLLTGKDINSVFMTTKLNVPAIFCDTHKTMVLKTYCKSHDDVICTCKITDHRKCVTTDISDQTRQCNVTTLLDDAVNSLTGLNIEFKKLKESRRDDTTKVKSQLVKCLDDMRSMRKYINQTFDKLESKFENSVRETEKRLIKEIEDHVRIADDALIQIANQIKALGEFRKSNNDDVMFVGMKRAIKLKSKYDKTLFIVQEAIYPIKIRYQANDVISDVMQQLKSIGTLDGLEHSSKGNKRPASLLEMCVVDKRENGVGRRQVWDCSFTKSGHLVLACGGQGLVLLNESFQIKSELSIVSEKVAVINENEVVVTQGYDQQLLRVQLFPQMVVMTTFKTERWCRGIDVFNDEIYVGCYDGKGRGEVQVLNIDGKIQRKLGVSNGEYMFKRTNSVKVSQDGSKIFVSDWSTHTVTCLNQQGQVIYQYSDPDLKGPYGLYVDADDILLVCRHASNNIHMVGRNGSKVILWLTEKDGMVNPWCVSYRQRDACVAVGLCNKDNSLLVFKKRTRFTNGSKRSC